MAFSTASRWQSHNLFAREHVGIERIPGDGQVVNNDVIRHLLQVHAGRFLRLALQNLLKNRLDSGDPLLDRSPHKLVVHAEKAVNKPVSHTSHLSPGDLGMSPAQIIGNEPGGFANDLKLPHDSARGFIISKKIVECHTVNEGLDALHGLKNIFRVGSIVSHIHIAVISLNTSSRISSRRERLERDQKLTSRIEPIQEHCNRNKIKKGFA